METIRENLVLSCGIFYLSTESKAREAVDGTGGMFFVSWWDKTKSMSAEGNALSAPHHGKSACPKILLQFLGRLKILKAER